MRRVIIVPVSLIFYVTIRVLPLRAASNFMAFALKQTAGLFFNFKAIDENLKSTFPNLETKTRRNLALEVIANFGRSIVEIVNLAVYVPGAGTTVKATGHLELPFSEDNQAIYVSAHLGNWELIPLVLANRHRKLNIIYTPLGDAFIDRKLMSLRRLTGSEYVKKTDALKACMLAMRKGESVAMLVEQRVDNGVRVNFFGHMTTFTRFPARLAIKFRCPIIFIEAIRVSPHEHTIHFHEPIWPSSSDAADPDQQLTQAVASKIEDAIRRRPADWFCNKRRWKRKDRVHHASIQMPAVAARRSLACSVPEI